MKFYCVRHGQTYFNTKMIFQGWCDSPLTEQGIQDAKATGIGMKDIPFIHAYSSTSERAVDTLDYIVGNREIPKDHRKDLKETHFGNLEGEKMDFQSKQFQDAMQAGFKEYGGESTQESAERFLNALRKIAEENKEGNILIVSHGAILSYVAGALNLKKMKEESKAGHNMDNCCAIIIDYTEGKFTLEDFGNSSFRDKGRQEM